MERCAWVTSDPLYLAYHDLEWGVPVHDDHRLFEMLILEGAQAGLSWLTILKRRQNYRAAYADFDPEVMAAWSDDRLAELSRDPGIIRNRLKIAAARTNARAFLRLVEEFGSFDRFVWAFVDGRPLRNRWRELQEVPATSPQSDRMSMELKRLGFKFAGSTICYAFMQAVGLVNDHLVNCYRHDAINKLS
jgi:DNA-3-methyladenine glycosylase I